MLLLSLWKCPYSGGWAEHASHPSSYQPHGRLAVGTPCSGHAMVNASLHRASLVLQRPSYRSVSTPWCRCPSPLGQTPLTACFTLPLSVLLYLFLCCYYWESKSGKLLGIEAVLVSHHCREARRCFAEGAADQLVGNCGSKLHLRCICSTQAGQPVQPLQQHEHSVSFSSPILLPMTT